MQKDMPKAAPRYIAHLDLRLVIFGLLKERLQVILVPSSEFAGQMGLPWQMIAVDQSLEDLAAEILQRFSGMRDAYVEQLYTYGDIARHPLKRLVSVVYFAMLPARTASSAQFKDDCQAQWFPVEELPLLVMNDRDVVAYALRRLRYKLECTAVGFQLLPEQFSLSELQQIYEMILGESLDKRNFRRRILEAGIIESTNQYRAGEGRPARLYRYRPDAVAEIKVRRLFP